MNNEAPKEEIKNEVDPETTVKIRQILIETDGTNVRVVKAEVAGRIELTAIFERLILFFNQPEKK